MNPMQMPMEEEDESGAGPDEVIIELLNELVQQGRSKRAESVMAPPMAPPADGAPADDEMAELEAMMAEQPMDAPGTPPAAPMPPPKKKNPYDDEEEMG